MAFAWAVKNLAFDLDFELLDFELLDFSVFYSPSDLWKHLHGQWLHANSRFFPRDAMSLGRVLFFPGSSPKSVGRNKGSNLSSGSTKGSALLQV